MTELRIVARCVLLLTGALACAGALAQAAPAAEPSASSAAAADRAQKQADRTLYWIRVLAEKPAPKPAAAAPAPKPAPAPARSVAAAAEPRPAQRVAASAAVPDPAPAPVAAAVVAAPPAAAAPTVPGAGRASVAAGVDAAPALAAGIAAPTLTPPEVDLPAPEPEEPDPGLIMVKSADPQFPMNTMRRLRKGEVEVRFEVGPDGQVEVVSVVRSTSASLNSYALDAVRQWQFKPTPHGHTAVVDLAFDLDA